MQRGSCGELREGNPATLLGGLLRRHTACSYRVVGSSLQLLWSKRESDSSISPSVHYRLLMSSCILFGVLLQSVAVFAEPEFPASEGAQDRIDVPGALVATSAEELTALLEEVDVLAWRHGANFPAELWSPFISFLERGGSLLHLGGEPFTHAVVGQPGARVVQPRSVSMSKELRLNQSYRVAVGGARLEYIRVHGLAPRELEEEAWVSILEPRFSDTKDFANEDGAPGSRDAILRPLAFLHQPSGDPNFPTATGSFAIDRLLGRFAGGRWVFHLTNTRPTKDELNYLLKEALRDPIDLRVDPTYGCFHEGERPSVNLRVHRPKAADLREFKAGLVVTRPDGSTQRSEHELRVGRHATKLVPLDVGDAPGLYRVTGFIEGYPPFETGFWIMDEALFKSGDNLSMGSWSLERNGKPEPVIGTTLMSGSVHRKFLFEPNAAEWDDSFRELASLDINFVRTGIWSAYKKISLDQNVVDEAFLRALEAYYLSARSHGIPVLFTFFSFVPEDFGGISPYFDPRSLEGGRAYASAIVDRFAETKEMLWDLINEPSFANPNKLWQCRPNGDKFEHAAFLEWLEERYSGSSDGRTWEDIVRARWRLLPDEAIGVPTEADFADRQVMESHRPYRAKEYAHFAQDAFRDWIALMTRAIRSSDSIAPVTVGQDEGGLFERPSPLYHHDVVDFTSIHTWWFNDNLVWDGLMAKAKGKPMLVSESGIMQRELLSGEAIRSPQTAARLLERKIASAFAAGAFGMVQWCYQVNPYMASDNEVGIGIKRVDGSYKPELDVMRRWAGFFARVGSQLQDYRESSAVVVLPSADLYSPRNLQSESIQRLIQLGRGWSQSRIVPEYRTAADLGAPDKIFLPSCRGISSQAWSDLLGAVDAGAKLYISGWFETDDAGLPAYRMGAEWAPLLPVELQAGDGRRDSRYVRFRREVFESWGRARFARDGSGDRAGSIEATPHGSGTILHHELPICWAEEFVEFPDGSSEDSDPRPRTQYTVRFGNDLALRITINDTHGTLDSENQLPPLEPGAASATLGASVKLTAWSIRRPLCARQSAQVRVCEQPPLQVRVSSVVG